MNKLIIEISDPFLFQNQLLKHVAECPHVVFLNNNSNDPNLLAISNSGKEGEGQWKFGFISYDYKNQLEKLNSDNPDHIGFPDRHFFSPELLFKICQSSVEIDYQPDLYTEDQVRFMLDEARQLDPEMTSNPVQITPRISKEEYLEKVYKLKEHIQLGDIYEVNFCQEFYAEKIELDPISVYIKLNEKSPTPFSSFVKHHDQFLMCASPERFMQKTGEKILSQPIKGTIRRGKNAREDELLKQTLLNDPKERSENVMIVDLVRNDLSRVAQKASVQVDELFGIYTFPQVHQMISTVSAKLKPETTFESIIQATFPMGSMTGAPKISSMELIEKYESTKRGIYSGTVGYIDEHGDFDFNVVIRSIIYNQKNKYLSFMVGGAITINSIPEKEYEECLLKAKAMMEVLSEHV